MYWLFIEFNIVVFLGLIQSNLKDVKASGIQYFIIQRFSSTLIIVVFTLTFEYEQ